MEDLKRAGMMERVLRDSLGEGNGVAATAKRYKLSEESVRTVLGIEAEEAQSKPELQVQSKSIIARIRDRFGF